MIPIEDFHIQGNPEIDRSIVAVRDILRELSVVAYDRANNTGDLKAYYRSTRVAYREAESDDYFCDENKGVAWQRAV